MQMSDQLVEAIREFTELMEDHIENIKEAMDNGEIDWQTGDEWADECDDALELVQELKKEV